MSIHVVQPGALTTVQDLGRRGFQNVGVPVAGPMDRRSHRLANQLVGNAQTAATLEVTLVGPVLEFDHPTVCAVCGAEFELRLGGAEVSMNTAWRADRGSRLRFGRRRRGARAYLAVTGGIDVPLQLGSRSTHVASRMGGMAGRPLVPGDRLETGSPDPRSPAGAPSCRPAVTLPDGGARVRVMLGPQDHLFPESALETLQTARYVVTSQSDRMGYHLQGPPLEPLSRGDMLSDATPIGTIQVPVSGQPIVLMADGQTTGGYPKIATLITADLGVAGQLAPGDWIEFEICDRRTAIAALDAQERALMA